MSKTHNLLLICLATIALTGGMLVQHYANTDTLMPSQSSQSDRIMPFNLPDLAGKRHTIAQWQGKIRIINFWATWCPPCLKEIPEFINIQQELADNGVQFIGIALDDKDSVATYLHTNPANYPMLIAGDEGIALSRQLGNRYDTIPFTLIVDQFGRIIGRQAGAISREKIMELIEPLLQNKR